MDRTTLTKLKKIVLFSYIVIFPFGQIPSFITSLYFHQKAGVHLADIIVFLYVVLSFLEERVELLRIIYNYLFKIVTILFLSLASGFILLNLGSVTALLYAARLTMYLIFFVLLFINKPLKRTERDSALLVIGVIISSIGLVQYFIFPDLRVLKAFGWDDHYYRLTAPFLDPAFTGIFLVFSILFLLSQAKGIKRLNIMALVAAILSLLLTYSRASYLALVVSIFVFALVKSAKRKVLFIAVCILSVSVFLLPRPGGEGVKLERTASIFLRVQNYQSVINVWKQSPLLGIGYNNMCAAYSTGARTTSLFSHSCSGADNSFLFIIATTGIVGAVIILFSGLSFLKKNKDSLFYSICAALFVHMQFTNTLFYPWVIGWIALFWSSKLSKEKN